jgi:hypothetical protein
MQRSQGQQLCRAKLAGKTLEMPIERRSLQTTM